MICNNLEGDYSTNKGDPMDESDPSDTDSNHAKLISTWTFVLMTEDGVDVSNQWYENPCYDYEDNYGEEIYIEGCTPSTEIKTNLFRLWNLYVCFLWKLKWNESNNRTLVLV